MSALDTAVAFLRDALAVDAVPATPVTQLADNAGVKTRALRRAFQKVGVQTFKQDSGGGDYLTPKKESKRLADSPRVHFDRLVMHLVPRFPIAIRPVHILLPVVIRIGLIAVCFRLVRVCATCHERQ
jgi:hypothetical protein